MRGPNPSPFHAWTWVWFLVALLALEAVFAVSWGVAEWADRECQGADPPPRGCTGAQERQLGHVANAMLPVAAVSLALAGLVSSALGARFAARLEAKSLGARLVAWERTLSDLHGQGRLQAQAYRPLLDELRAWPNAADGKAVREWGWTLALWPVGTFVFFAASFAGPIRAWNRLEPLLAMDGSISGVGSFPITAWGLALTMLIGLVTGLVVAANGSARLRISWASLQNRHDAAVATAHDAS